MSLPMPIATWQVLAPAGLTSTGRIRQFQQRTVQKLQDRAREIADAAFSELRSEVEHTYREGEGTLLSTLQYRVSATRDGISVQFMAGGRHLVYLTALAGLPLMSPGHEIKSRRPGGLLRFFWKNPPGGDGPGVYRMHEVFWRTRQGRDVLAEVLGDHAVRFEQEMIRAHEEALVQFIQENAQPATRSPRVTALNVNQIGPR